MLKSCESVVNGSVEKQVALIIRLNLNGAIDTTYGIRGNAVVSPSKFCSWNAYDSLRFDGNDYYTVLYCENNNTYIVKLDHEGNLVFGFGSDGLAQLTDIKRDHFETIPIQVFGDQLLIMNRSGSQTSNSKVLDTIKIYDKNTGAIISTLESNKILKADEVLTTPGGNIEVSGRTNSSYCPGKKGSFSGVCVSAPVYFHSFAKTVTEALNMDITFSSIIENIFNARSYVLFDKHVLGFRKVDSTNKILAVKLEKKGLRYKPVENFGSTPLHTITIKDDYDIAKNPNASMYIDDVLETDISEKPLEGITPATPNLKVDCNPRPAKVGARLIFSCYERDLNIQQDVYSTLVAFTEDGEIDLSFGKSGHVRIPTKTYNCDSYFLFLNSMLPNPIFSCDKKNVTNFGDRHFFFLN